MLCRRCRTHLRLTLLSRPQLHHQRHSPSYSTAPPPQPSTPSHTLEQSTTRSAFFPDSKTDIPVANAVIPPSPSTHSTVTTQKTKETLKQKERQPSSVAGGTKLIGLGFLKAQPDIYAKEDSEYPEWLWDVVAPEVGKKGDKKEVAGSAPLNAKQRRRLERKQAERAASRPVEIPIHKQSVDLTGPDAGPGESLRVRGAAVKAMRGERRKGIREANFLRGM